MQRVAFCVLFFGRTLKNCFTPIERLHTLVLTCRCHGNHPINIFGLHVKIARGSANMPKMNEYFDDINFTNLTLDSSEKEFHSTVGHIEDILVEDKFLQLLNKFMDKYWKEFENTEENKLVYMDIFKEYQATVEKYIEEELVKKISNFNMNTFEQELKQRQNEIDDQIFELLSTFTDFLEFKTMFLDYRAMKEGQLADFSDDFSVSKYVFISE